MTNRIAAFLPKEFDSSRLVNLPTFRVGVTANDASVGKNPRAHTLWKKLTTGCWQVSSRCCDSAEMFVR
jgi:hypothetical protein